VQNSFSLLEQGDRETVFPLCHEHAVGYEPFSPLAGGWLSGKYRRGEEPPAGSRMTQRPGPYVGYAADDVFDALDLLADEAAERGVTMAALSLAWALHLPEVTGVVVGPNRPEHLDDVRSALEVFLTGDERARIGALFA
jgi:aryl-alcohol dehydrogenase-like predicted oxidoreductase